MQSRPDLFWGLIASMWVGNLLLLVLNLPLIGIWVRLLGIPYRFLCPASLSALAPEGRLIFVGNAGGGNLEVELWQAMQNNQTLHGVFHGCTFRKA